MFELIMLNWVVTMFHVLLAGTTQVAAFGRDLGWSWKVQGGHQSPRACPHGLDPSVVSVVLPYSLVPGLWGGGSFQTFYDFGGLITSLLPHFIAGKATKLAQF